MNKGLILLFGVVALAGCRERTEPVEAGNASEAIEVENLTAPPPAVVPVAPPVTETNTSAEVPNAAPSVSEQAQMQEDADATGMTARSTRDASEADAATERTTTQEDK